MELTVEVERQGVEPALPGGGAALAAFMSFCSMRGFGAVHPLLALADELHARGVALGPLSTFYDGTVEDAEDREKLNRAWQEAAPLAAAATGLADMLESDPESALLAGRGGAEGLGEQARELATIAARAAASGARVRLTYRL